MLSNTSVSSYGDTDHQSPQSFKLMQQIFDNHRSYWGVKSGTGTVYKNGYSHIIRRSVSKEQHRIQFLPYPQLVEPIDELYSHLVHVASTSTCAPSTLLIDSLNMKNKLNEKPSHKTTTPKRLVSRRNDYNMSLSLVETLKSFNFNLGNDLKSSSMKQQMMPLQKDLEDLEKQNSKVALSKVSLMDSGYISINSNATTPRTSINKEIEKSNNDLTANLDSVSRDNFELGDQNPLLKTSVSKQDLALDLNSENDLYDDTNQYDYDALLVVKPCRQFVKEDSDLLLDQFESFTNIDDFITFAEETLLKLRHDFNKFKQDSWQRLSDKVSCSEFSETTTELREKLCKLEEKLLMQHCLMCQEVYEFKERISALEVESVCGIKNYNIWPWLIFVTTYTFVNFGRR